MLQWMLQGEASAQRATDTQPPALNQPQRF